MSADDLALMTAAAREAGALALDLAKGGVEKWEKSPGNPVTEADVAIDGLLSRRLLSRRPDYGWLSEERADDLTRLNRDRAFLVDPIDGTRDYVRGRSGWCISIAVIDGGIPTVGLLYAPVPNLLYTARLGKGAYRNGERISVSGKAELSGARLPLDADTFRSKYWQGPPCAPVAKPNSIALRMARVAEGEADAMFDGRPSRELDIAAAALIVMEAGGIVTDSKGAAPSFNKPVARNLNLVASATQSLHEEVRAEMTAMIDRWRADRAAKRN
ncbi:3'(2'),5'-bisphosphate nucleotidase CysQ [Pacificimonas sp. WHA3]|uniref:3'(2'),5'-bisphosphate nucleotidase CysQ n=1 Tax=Pacificimonas pallii TaxID=2827236 RepID=A0ABS6SGX0_9SPHN|nr:3'(2'),5'-bisphosphate nucleotidase CysQ [Pacificimonas pallii]MBV7257635.1 3'(2'),5'-bisphosphate nucleotidase CysQ [Pacificimonas pallii]